MPNKIEKIVLERMYRLIELAEEEFPKHPKRSSRYIELIKKLNQRNKVKIPKKIKLKFCKKCNTFLIEGKNLKRQVNKFIKSKCLSCGFESKTSV